jgi:hypothetical protein
MEKREVVPNRRIKRIIAVVVAMGLGLWAATTGVAQGSGPCAEDVAKFCKDVQPGGGRMAQCLKTHENELSGSCKEHILKMKQRGREFHEACQDDVTKLCKDVKPGGGRIMHCLKEHKDELSPECKEKLPARRGGR